MSRGEKRVSLAMLFLLRVALAAALASMLWTYFERVRPTAGEIPTWLDIGFPLAICVGVAHFLRRALQALREMKSS